MAATFLNVRTAFASDICTGIKFFTKTIAP